VNLDVLTRGVSTDQWLQQASGAVSLRFTDGAINGINIGREIRRAGAALAGGSVSAQETELKTDFSELSISGEINEGVLSSDDLSI
jgi:AsmA protein